MLLVNCGIWIVTLLIFLFSFEAFVNFPDDDYRVSARYSRQKANFERETASVGQITK